MLLGSKGGGGHAVDDPVVAGPNQRILIPCALGNVLEAMAEALDAGLALHPVHDHHQHGPGHGAVGRKPFAGYAVEERAAEHIVDAQVRPMLNSLHILKLPAGAVQPPVAFVQGGITVSRVSPQTVQLWRRTPVEISVGAVTVSP